MESFAFTFIYIGTYTVKFNYTISPSGLITHLSKAWGGKASDKCIVLKEKILEKFSTKEAVMVDKGYNILEETKAKGNFNVDLMFLVHYSFFSS